MGNRTAKFISALVGSIVAGAPLAAVSQNAPVAPSTTNAAASDCLASAKGTAPQGQHWYYRLDRATKRQCWYLRAEGGKTTQSAQATDTPSADSTASPSVQNARAEYIAPQAAPNVTAPAPAAASAPPVAQQPSGSITDANTEQAAVAARWPDASATAAAPAPVAAVAKPAKPAAAVALAAAEIPADKPTGSLQMLLLVIGGALALAGMLASVIYRFAGGRVRVRAADHRRANWDDWEPHDLDDSRAPWLDATPAAAPRAQRPHPIDFDAARPQAPHPQAPHLAAFSNEIGRIAAQSRAPQNEVAHDLDEADIFNREFEIETSAPQLAVNDTHDEEPVDDKPGDRDEEVQTEDAIDIDIITAMLERLAQEGPRLSQPSPDSSRLDLSPGAVLVDLARSPRGQSAARA
jgi:hypothetical protein